MVRVGRKAVAMAHTIRERTKLLARVRRIKGQCEAIERALESEAGCSATLQLIAAARGAMNGLMAEVLEKHLVAHVLNEASPDARDSAATELIDVVKAYLK
ncbi:MAG: metal/formaldehyde-sensitive transcriptional repressor [Vulcanimicrobiaceae bacterium]